MQTLCHPFVNEVREKSVLLPNKSLLPFDLYTFTKEEINSNLESAKYRIFQQDTLIINNILLIIK